MQMVGQHSRFHSRHCRFRFRLLRRLATLLFGCLALSGTPAFGANPQTRATSVDVRAAEGSQSDTGASKVLPVDSPLTKDIKRHGPAAALLVGGWALIRSRTRHSGIDLAFNGLPLGASRAEPGTASTKRIKRNDDRTGPVEFGPPEGLPPAVISVLEQQDRHTKQLTSTLVDLAARGYLAITEETRADSDDKTWRLTKANKQNSQPSGRDSTLHSYERQLLEALFRKRKTLLISELENSFQKPLVDFLDNVDREVKQYGWFKDGSVTNMAALAILAFVLVFLAPIFLVSVFATSPSLSAISPWSVVGSFFLLAVIAMRRGYRSAKPYRTSKGSAMYSRVLGFRKFLVAGEHRLEHAERAKLFVDFLPYAIAMGIVDEWSKRFTDLGQLPEMDWYQGSGRFEPTVFGRQLEAFSRQSLQSLESSKSLSAKSSTLG
jgi:Predicted membrane protein (DUF2207)